MKLRTTVVQWFVARVHSGWWVAAVLLLGCGCASVAPEAPYVIHPAAPTEEVRAGLGPITVVGAEALPAKIARPANKGSAAGKGGLGGFAASLGAGAQSGDAFGFAAGVFLSPLAAVGGAVYGSCVGMSPGEYERITATLQEVMRDGNVSARLEQGCIDAIRERAPRWWLAPTNPAAGVVPAIMEITPMNFELQAGNSIDPPMTLNCTVQVRLLRGDDHAELYIGQFHYVGGTVTTLREWADHGGEEFRKGITAAGTELAGQIIERVLLVYTMPCGFVESRRIPCNDKE